MSFGSGHFDAPPSSAIGTCFNERSATILTASDGGVPFVDGLKIGLFAQIKGGKLDNMDATATPTVAGVVLGKVSRASEETVIDASKEDVVNYVRAGLVTVAGTGTVPDYLAPVYTGTDGIATASNADTATSGEFVDEISTGVWLVRLV